MACDSVFPMTQTRDGDLYPAGTDGSCVCGSDEFTIIEGHIQPAKRENGP